MSEGQRAYEQKRAAKAGMSLEKWLANREKDKRAAASLAKPAPAPAKPKPPGLLSRLIEKARKPL
ncbi:MAG: hypothetical protein ACP5NI_07940 [Acetobacteraceae bacterium]